MKQDWRRGGNYYLELGKWTIAKCFVGGVARYSLWAGLGERDSDGDIRQSQHIGVYDTAGEAKGEQRARSERSAADG